MADPLKPSFEDVGIFVTIAGAIAAFFGWVYSKIKGWVYWLIMEKIQEHERGELKAFSAFESSLTRLDERTNNIISGLDEMKADVKQLIRMSGEFTDEEANSGDFDRRNGVAASGAVESGPTGLE